MSLIALDVPAQSVFKWVDANGKVHYGDADSGANVGDKSQVEIEPDPTSEIASPADATSPQPKVVMYSTSWCGYCKRARAFFRRNAIAFAEYDIEKSAPARREYDKLGGRGVPFITIGDHKISGYNRDQLKSALGI